MSKTTFTSGVEPMGLFWSLKWEPSCTRHGRWIKDDVDTPLIVTLSVIDGHYSWENLFDLSIKPLATIEVHRCYKHKSVRRIEVKHGSTRGSLFIPPGEWNKYCMVPFNLVPEAFLVIAQKAHPEHLRGPFTEKKVFLWKARGLADGQVVLAQSDGLGNQTRFRYDS